MAGWIDIQITYKIYQNYYRVMIKCKLKLNRTSFNISSICAIISLHVYDLTFVSVDGGDGGAKPETTVGDSVSTFERVITLDIFEGDISQPRLCNQNRIFLDEMLRLSNLISGNKPHILMRHRDVFQLCYRNFAETSKRHV